MQALLSHLQEVVLEESGFRFHNQGSITSTVLTGIGQKINFKEVEMNDTE